MSQPFEHTDTRSSGTDPAAAPAHGMPTKHDHRSNGSATAQHDRLAEWLREACHGRLVLCVGCSDAVWPVLIDREGRHIVAIETARDARQPQPQVWDQSLAARVEVRTTDLLSMPVLEKFDSILIAGVAATRIADASVLEAVARLLAPNGRVLLVLPFGQRLAADPSRAMLPRQVVDALAPFLACESVTVEDGQIRVVAAARGDLPVAAGVAGLLEMTEKGALALQDAAFVSFLACTELEMVSADKDAQLDALQGDHHEMALELVPLRTQVLEMRNESLRMEQKLKTATSQAQRAKVEAERRNGELAREVRRRTFLEKKVKRIESEQRQLKRSLVAAQVGMAEAKREVAAMQGSVSFRLGRTLVDAMKSPRDFMALPVRLARLASRRQVRNPGQAQTQAAVAGDEPVALAHRRASAGDTKARKPN